MKAVVLLAVLAVAYGAPHVEDKRFIADTFQSIGHWFTDLWHTVQADWNKLTHAIPLDTVVGMLVPMIDSGMTESACSTVCVGAAATVLGPIAALAGTACPLACKAALGKLQQLAG